MKKFLMIFSLIFLLSGCAEDPNIALRDEYLATGEQVSTDLVEVGTQLETLMNLQNNALAWSDAEKQELNSIEDKITTIQSAVDAMQPSTEFVDAHPALVDAVSEMSLVVEKLQLLADNPNSATDSLIAELEEHAMNIELYGNTYVEAMEAAVSSME